MGSECGVQDNLHRNLTFHPYISGIKLRLPGCMAHLPAETFNWPVSEALISSSRTCISLNVGNLIVM